MPVTSIPFCNLIGMSFERFETKRRRLKAATALSAEADSKINADDIEPLPVKDRVSGRWAVYDFEDALLMACALRLETVGLDFAAAARMVINAGAKGYFDWSSRSDFWIARGWSDHSAMKHVGGSKLDVQMPGATAVLTLNVSDVARSLHAKAAVLGLSVDGTDVNG